MGSNAGDTGSSISYPEVKVSEIQFGITLRSYKIRIKLASDDPSNFTPTFSKCENSIISSVRQSVEMPCYLPPHYFTFYAQMEKENPVYEEHDPQNTASPQSEVCVFYLKLKDLPEDEFLLMKHAVNVVCECECNQESGLASTMDFNKKHFLDCANEPMAAVSSSNPLVLSVHQHDFSAHGLQQHYYLSISVFDFSKASIVPFEAQRTIARKRCSLQLRDIVVEEWVKPFDLTIKCKGGYSIAAHKAVLSARSRVFKSMLESDFQEAKMSIVHVMDLNAPVMKVILHFIYTGELDSEWTRVSVEDIVYGADKYELLDLLGFFDHLMICGCNTQNALRLAQLSLRHSLRNANDQISGFIRSNLGAVFNKTVSLSVKRV